MATRNQWIAVVACLISLGAASQGSAVTHRPWKRRPGVILYHLKTDASSVQRTALARVLNQHSTHSLMSAPAAQSHQTLAFAWDGRDEEETAEEMRASGAVEFAEPDYLMPAAASIPDDPQYASQWFHQTLNSPAAWSYATGNNSIIVAVCDTGVDASHPDLAPNLNLPGFNVVDHTTDTSAVAPHGTAVAGVIGAVGNNNLGVTGMDWTIKILPVRITNNADTTAWCSDMAAGIVWAADHGAKVINLSYETVGCPATINSASQYARSRGALVFVAAGNSATDLSGQYSISQSFILVGATDISDHQAIFSNYGAPVLLAAPGANILTTQPGGYGTVNGTSFSAPLAAGVAALIYSLNPSWSPSVVQNLLLATAKSMGSNLGYGRVDAGAALAAAQTCLTGACLTPAPLGSNPPQAQPNVLTASAIPAVRAFPNPWRSNLHQTLDVTFDQLAANTDIRIFTISGRQVRRLATGSGSTTWNLTNDSGERVASGVYLFLAKDTQGQDTRGKIAVIR